MRLPHLELPALAITGGGAWIATPSGEARQVSEREARDLIAERRSARVPRAVCGLAPWREASGALYDVLDLFVFVRPGDPCLPSPLGLAQALKFAEPQTAEESARTLHAVAGALLDGLLRLSPDEKDRARKTAAAMAKAGWRWGPSVLAVLGEPERASGPLAGFDAWRGLDAWEDEAPEGPPSQHPIDEEHVQARLQATVLRYGGARKQQREFTTAAMPAFAPRVRAGAPRIALVEAGTGTGKTLGYLAPATLWAEKNGPGLWISTYTRNLQRQIVQEIAQLYPDPDEREDKAVVRKGRENYLCLLNFEEAAKRTALAPGQRTVALALIARWISATTDGDLSGADFPAFLAASMPLRDLTDRRGECIYAACPHYRTASSRRACAARAMRRSWSPIMRWSSRRRRRTAWRLRCGRPAAGQPPALCVRRRPSSVRRRGLGFARICRAPRWRSCAAGCAARRGAVRARADWKSGCAICLRTTSKAQRPWRRRSPRRACWRAKAGLRASRAARAGRAKCFWPPPTTCARPQQRERRGLRLEAEAADLPAEVIAAARALDHGLARLIGPLMRVAGALRARLNREAAELDDTLQIRLEAAARGLDRRARLLIPSWRTMLAALDEVSDGPSEFADWFEIAREDGRDIDVGLDRHWIDPTIPFAEAVLKPAHGALITSATLRDSGGGEEVWIGAQRKSAPAPTICPSRPRAPCSARRSIGRGRRASSS